MSTRFKLACPHCSSVHQVGQSQAGEALMCQCGHELNVPTLRELRALEPVQETGPTGASPDWDVRRGFLFVSGALLIAAGALTTWRILPQRQTLTTARPEFREITFDVQTLTPTQAWEAWKHFREQKLDYRVTPKYLEDRSQYQELSRYLYAGWAAATIGLMMILGSLFWRTSKGFAER